MLRALLVLMMAALGFPAAAQIADWCGASLSFQTDPATALVWRLRCTIQILDRERAEAEDHVTTAEVDKAVSEAHLRAVTDELTKTREELEKLKPTEKPVEKKK